MRNKKWLAIGMTTIMMISALTGCGNSGQDTAPSAAGTEESSTAAASEETAQDTASAGEEKNDKEMVTIRMWGGVPPESGPQKACDDFNALYADKGIQVENERFVNDETGNLKLETNLRKKGRYDSNLH